MTAVMGGAFLLYTLGMFNLNHFFGLVGGLMTPIIAGIFPFLIFVACRRWGIHSDNHVVDALPGRFIVLLVLAGFAAIYVWQAVPVSPVVDMRSRPERRLSNRSHDCHKKGRDGWDPKTRKIFERGRAVDHISLAWKPARNGDFHAISQSTIPVRTLSMVHVEKGQLSARRFDVSVIDRGSDRPVAFSVDESDPGFLDIAIKT